MINRISPDNIGQLNEREFVGLLRVLLHSEARQRGISKSGVHVPLQINVADAGEDGRWKAAIETSDFIPNVFTVYQCKATKIGPTACQDEILANRGNTKGESLRLKSKVEEVLNANGCYCIFCSASYVKEDIDDRLKTSREALKEAGRPKWESEQLAFLDGNQIATWVNWHAAAIAYVSEACRITQPVTFTTWYDWERYPQIMAFPFEKNAYLEERITLLRNTLCKPSSTARIVGQCGLGKSRLAFEVFRPVEFSPDAPKNTTLTDSMVYFDFEDSTNEKIEIVRQLAHQGISGIIVVDNCERQYHEKLEDFVKMRGSKLSLLTLDYEPDEPPRSGCVCVDLKPASLEELIPRLLQHIPAAMKLTSPQRDYIATFCQGFPQIAFLLAESQAPLSIDVLDERKFVTRLLWGREQENDRDRRVIQSLALFRHVGAEGQRAAQLRFLSKTFCDMEEHEFRDRCHRFQRIRVIQKVGDFWMVTPRPVAVALAAQWWESTSATEIRQLLPGIESAEMMEGFCNQLRLLNFSLNAQAVTADLCAPNGFFGDAEVLFSGSGSRLFRALVELNPTASLQALQSAFATKSLDELTLLAEPRRNLVWALEKLCWPSALFPIAARLLLQLAAAENETCSNNATGQFKQLFQLCLGGTEVPAFQRLEVIQAGLSLEDKRIHEVCIAALGVALVAVGGHFMRFGGAEIRGSNLPQTDWSPSTDEDIIDFQFEAFSILRVIASKGGDLSLLAKAEIGKRFGSLIRGPNYKRLVPELSALIVSMNGYWPEVRSSIENFLEHSASGVPGMPVQQLQKWLSDLEPSDLRLRIRQAVSEAGYRHQKNAQGHYVDISAEQATQLGRDLGPRENEWLPFINALLRGRQNKAYDFGVGLIATYPHPSALIQTCLAALKEIPAGERNVSLLGGMMRGLHDVNSLGAVLEQVVNDGNLVDMLVALTVYKPLEREDLERVVSAIEAGKINLLSLRQFCYGSVTDTLSPQDLTEVLLPLTTRNPLALLPAYEIFAMYTFNSPSRWQFCKTAIKKLFISDRFVELIQGSPHEHQWTEHSHALLNESGSEEFAVNQTQQLVQVQFLGAFGYAQSPYKHKMLSLLLEKHGNTCWQIVGDALLRDDYYPVQDLIRAEKDFTVTPVGADHEKYWCPIWTLAPHVLTEWCKKNPISTERLLEVIGLFTTESDGSFLWHPVALELLRQCYRLEFESAVECNLINFGSSGSRQPYIQRRIDLVALLQSSDLAPLRELSQNLLPKLHRLRERALKDDEQFRAGVPF
jgi:hypothetical protein